MGNRMRRALEYYGSLDVKSMSVEERKDKASELLIQIGFFQHERLIHLIVTVLFALFAMFAVYGSVTTDNFMFYVLTVAVFVLLIPYVNHYYLLENGVQRLYKDYDRLARL